MSEETVKFFKVKKVVPTDVIFVAHPFSNPEISKTIKLTHRVPSINLSADYAAGIFADDETYVLYKKGIITFEDNKAVLETVYQMGAYYSDELDFSPVTKDDTDEILAILKAGNRANILNAISTKGKDRVQNVAILYASELTTNVVAMLENILHVQLVMDGGNE